MTATVNVTTGTALDLLTTAAGRVFAAWMPKKIVAPLIAEELKSAKLPPALKSRAAVDALLARIREQGYAPTDGQHKVPGVEATYCVDVEGDGADRRATIFPISCASPITLAMRP